MFIKRDCVTDKATGSDPLRDISHHLQDEGGTPTASHRVQSEKEGRSRSKLLRAPKSSRTDGRPTIRVFKSRPRKQ